MNPFSEDTDEDNNEMRRLTHVLSDEDATAMASDSIKRAQGIFETICEQRFTSFPGSFDEDSDNENNSMKEEDEEDLWADKTKEISFATKSQQSQQQQQAQQTQEKPINAAAVVQENNDKNSSS